MPIPKPKPGERSRAFVSRCMADPVMMGEFPDKSARAAVCWAQTPAGKQAEALAQRMADAGRADLLRIREAAVGAAQDADTRRAEAAMERFALAYFRAMRKTFPADAVARALEEPDSFQEAKRIIPQDRVDAIFADWQSSDLVTDATNTAAELLGGTTNKAKAKTANEIAKSRKVSRVIKPDKIKASSQWARKHAGDMIADINNTTRKQIRKIVSQGIAAKDRPGKIANSIEEYLSDDAITRERARSIAITEVNNAKAHGADFAARATGAQYKRWIARWDRCEICKENEQAGQIGIDMIFPSGHMMPTAHPNCRCKLRYTSRASKQAIDKAMIDLLYLPDDPTLEP